MIYKQTPILKSPSSTLVPLKPIRLIHKLNAQNQIQTDTINNFKNSLGEGNILELSDLIKNTAVRFLKIGESNLVIPGFSFFDPIESSDFDFPPTNGNYAKILDNLQDLITSTNYPTKVEPIEDVGLTLRVLIMILQVNREKWLIAFYLQQVHLNIYRLIHIGGEDDLIHHSRLGLPDDGEIIGDLEAGHTWLSQICLNDQLARDEQISNEFFSSILRIQE